MPVTVSPFCQGPSYHVGERQWPVSSMTCKQLCSSAWLLAPAVAGDLLKHQQKRTASNPRVSTASQTLQHMTGCPCCCQGDLPGRRS